MVPRAEVEHGWDLVTDPSRGRLLTVNDDRERPAMDVIHEALYWAWSALIDWIGEHRDSDLWRQRLAARAESWAAAPGPARDDLLMRGTVLDLALARSAERRDELAPLKTAFIAESAASRRRKAPGECGRWRLRGGVSLAVAALAGAPPTRFRRAADPSGRSRAFDGRRNLQAENVREGPCPGSPARGRAPESRRRNPLGACDRRAARLVSRAALCPRGRILAGRNHDRYGEPRGDGVAKAHLRR